MLLSVKKIGTLAFICTSLFLGNMANAGALIFKNESGQNISIKGCIDDNSSLSGAKKIGSYYYFNTSSSYASIPIRASRSRSCSAWIYEVTPGNPTSEGRHIATVILAWYAPGRSGMDLDIKQADINYGNASSNYNVEYYPNRAKHNMTFTIKRK